MARLHLELLGGFSARLEGGQPCTLPTRKARALLAYLALPAGRFHSRDKLTALLWGETPEAQARQSFRQALASLRRVLGEGDAAGLLTQGDAIALDPGAVAVDVTELERALAEGGTDALERAARLYQGDLLDGFSLDVAPFEEWRVVERERLHERVLEGLARLLREQLRADRSDAAIQTALRILALDPLQEAVHRALMRLLLRQGRRAAALEQYQVCVGWLQRELSAEPEEETRTLYRELLRGAGGAGAHQVGGEARSALRALPRHQPAEGSLVGRVAETDTLRQALDRTLDVGARVVVISGEAGIGKTRLLQELGAEASARGVRILAAWCHETEQALPFRPWIDALRHGASLDPGVYGRLSPGARGSLSRLFPELARPDQPPVTMSDEHGLLFEAMGELVGHVAAEAAAVIVLEDLQWADAMSARLLAFLGRRLGRRPVLIVGSLRPEDAAEDGVLGPALGELRAAGRLDEVALDALSRDESLALARAAYRGGRDPGIIEDVADDLWALSEGNPFTIVETVRALVQDVPLRDERRPSLPRTVRESVASRLARLSAGARQVVAAAAVIGRSSSFPLLHQAAGLGESETAAAVEELVRRRVLDGVGERLAFCHDRIRQVAYDDLLPARRIVLHRAVAHALETLHAPELDEVADELGHHFLRAGDAEKALVYLTRFADVAARRYALDAALHALEQAAEAVERSPQPQNDRRRLDIALRQAFIMALAGRHGECLALLRAHAPREGRARDPALAAEYYFRLAMTGHYLGDYVEARRAAEAAVAEGVRAQDDQRLGKALYALSLVSVLTGAVSAAVRHASRAVPLLDDSRTPHWLGLVCWILAYSLSTRGELDSALEHAERCAAIGHAAGDRRLRSMAGVVTSWVQAARGDVTAARASAQEARDISRDPVASGLALSALGSAELAGGDGRAAVEAFGRAVDLPGAAFSRVRALALLSEAQLAAGDPARAAETASQALERAHAIGAPFLIGLAERATGRIVRATGDPGRGEAHLSRALAAFLSGEAELEAAMTRLDLARALAVRGERVDAQAQLGQAARAFEKAGAPQRTAQAHDLARSLGVTLADGRALT